MRNYELLSYKMQKENEMIINLTKSVPLKEWCKITAHGHTTDTEQCIEFVFSHEAIIGFATELLWIYEDINDNRKLVVSTNQLQIDPSPSQALGFYLTPNSPILVLKVNSLMERKEEGYEYKNWKEINIRKKNVNQYYSVKAPSDEEGEVITLEPYELSKKNIMDISIFNAEGDDITKNYSTVILEINRKGIKEFATMLLVWANNYKEGDEYILPHIDKLNCGDNLGIILDHGSISTKFKGHDLGTAYDYDSRI